MKKRVAVAFLLSFAFIALGAGAASGSDPTLTFLTATDLALQPGGSAPVRLVVGGGAQPVTFDVDGLDRSAFTVRFTGKGSATAGVCGRGSAAPVARALRFPFCVRQLPGGRVVSFELAALKRASGSGVLVAIGARDGALAARSVTVTTTPVASPAPPDSITVKIWHSDACEVIDESLVTSEVAAIASGPDDVALMTLTNKPPPGCGQPSASDPASASSTLSGTTTTTAAPAATAAEQTYLVISGATKSGSYIGTVDVNGAADGGTVKITAQRTWELCTCWWLLVLGAAVATLLSFVGGRVAGAVAAVRDRDQLKKRLLSAQQTLVKRLTDTKLGDSAPGWSAMPGDIWTKVDGLPGVRKAVTAAAEDLPGGVNFEKARTDVAAYETAAAAVWRITVAHERLAAIAPDAAFTSAAVGFLEQGAAPAGNGFEAAPIDLEKIDDTVEYSATALSRIAQLLPAVAASSLSDDTRKKLKTDLESAKAAVENNTDLTKLPAVSPWVAIGAARAALAALPAPKQHAARGQMAATLPPIPARPDLGDAIAKARESARRASTLSIWVAVVVALAGAVVAVLIGLTTTYYSAETWGTGADKLKAFVWAFSLAGGLQVAGYIGFSPSKKA